MVLLNDAQLLFFCNSYNLASPTFAPRLTPQIQLMFATGCRLVESCEATRWARNGNIFVLDTAKRNNDRIIPVSDIPSIALPFLEAQINVRMEKPQNTYQYNMQLYFGNRYFWVGEKKAYNHLFRHNVARQKKSLGWTDKKIQVWLGEKTLIAAEQYIYSDIYSNLPV